MDLGSDISPFSFVSNPSLPSLPRFDPLPRSTVLQTLRDLFWRDSFLVQICCQLPIRLIYFDEWSKLDAEGANHSALRANLFWMPIGRSLFTR